MFYSTSSPFARMVRIALIEKAVPSVEPVLVNPWQDAPDLIRANPSCRVPALVLDDGTALSESQMIIAWMDREYPQPPLYNTAALALAGIAVGAIEAAAAIIIGRRATDAGFDTSAVGLRRRRSIVTALDTLEAQAAALERPDPDLAVIATVTLVDYLHFRFGGAEWMPQIARLDALSQRLRARPSFAETMPTEMPAQP
nr:glutathione S-transferase N-terminal domain-containing protein [Pseudogemmobacter hezensis]